MSELSFPGVLNQLCEGHLGHVQRASRVQPTFTRIDALKRLRKKAYDAFFSSLEDMQCDISNGGSRGICLRAENEGFFQEIDRLRASRQHKDADRLQDLKDSLSDPEYRCYLRFLIALKGTGENTKGCHKHDGFGSKDSARNRNVTKISSELTVTPPCYGDDDISSASGEFCYMHYPRQIFENFFAMDDDEKKSQLNNILTLTPGMGVGQGGFFSQQFLLKDKHEEQIHSSLFGGLVQGKAEDINSTFDLPELPQFPSFRVPEFKPQKSASISQLSDESGVGSSGSASMSSSVMTLPAQPEQDPWFWVNALTVPRLDHYTWERRGVPSEPTESPYLSEAGPEMFDLLLRHRRKVLAIICPSPDQAPPSTITVQPDLLVKDLLLMLTGVPSPHFKFKPDLMRFEVCEGLQICGSSPEMLSDFLTEFVDCGSYLARLVKFSQAPVLNSFYNGGHVFQAFSAAVRKALAHFTAGVLNTSTNLGLIQLKVFLHEAMEQIKYLANLCQCLDGPPKPLTNIWGGSVSKNQPERETKGFPVGMKLLSYLYDEANVAINSSHYPLLLSLLQTTSAPFVLFIRDWVFHGVVRDSYEEFLIKVNASYVGCKNEQYWSSAYTLNTQAAVPEFLQEIVEEIVMCGKSINLLRLCDPGHFLCNLNERQTPSIYIAYSKSVLRAMEQDCQTYVGRMQQIARRLTTTREEMIQKAEAAKLELQQAARRMADQEIERLQGIINERRRKANEKKQVEFSRLKQQMEADLDRRARDRQVEREEDERLMAKITGEEEALTVEEIELERRAREELIEYYTSLGEEAAHRERLALWKVQRARLAVQREEFLERDAQSWGRELQLLAGPTHKKDAVGLDRQWKSGSQLMAEMDDLKQKADSTDAGIDVPDSGAALPNWVERYGGGDRGTPMEVSGSEEVKLPAWAMRELAPVFEEEALDEDEEKRRLPEASNSDIVLPSWVLREAEGDDLMADIEERSDEGTVLQEAKVSQLQQNNVSKDNEDVVYETMDRRNDTVRRLRSVQIGGGPLPKPHVRTSTDVHSLVESEETKVKPSTQTVAGKHASQQSEDSTDIRPSIRRVQGADINDETKEVGIRVHVKPCKSMTATTESKSESLNPAPHLKHVEGVQVNQQTTEQYESIPRRAKVEGQSNVSSQSAPKVWTIKKPSVYGHVSKVSMSDYALTVPKLKRQAMQHANKESEFKDFGIKPRIRMSKTMSATQESKDTEASKEEGGSAASKLKPQIRMVEGRNSSTESERIDVYEVSRQRFLVRNRKGHASDSSVQQLLYGGDGRVSRWHLENAKGRDEQDGAIPRISLIPGQPYEGESFQTNFVCLGQEPQVDLMSNVVMVDVGHDLVDSAPNEEEVETYRYTPLSILLTRSVTAPVQAQISMVNTAVVNYFMCELRIDDHFLAIRRYLLMADGDFSEILANILFEKLSTNPLPQEVFNPLFLNGALTKAVRSSIYPNDKLASNLSFAFTHMPSVLMPNAPTSLSCLELRYMVHWPYNVVLTKKCMQKYCKIFGFLLQIKRVVWTLKDVWHRLKRDALVIRGAANSSHFRHMQLYRQEMEHFVKAMQGYITSQVIHVSWQEFQSELAQPTAGLADIQARHKRYVDKAVAKCLLDKKAAQVTKVIQDIFCLILKFRTQLASATWQVHTLGETKHPKFDAIKETHNSFHLYSFFLFKVLNRLAQKGYQPHLQELLLQLNFNDFYKEAAS